MLKAFLCKHLGHRVDRRRVWHDDIDFRTTCARCGEPLVRGKAGWREFDAERDLAFERKSRRADDDEG